MSSDKQLLRHRIQVLCSQGLSIKEITRQCKVSRNTVRKWARKQEGDVTDAQRPGKPTKFSPRTKDKVRKWVKDKVGVGTRTVAKKLNFSDSYKERGKTISHSAISKYLRKTTWGKHAYTQKVKPMLSQKNITDRVNFCTRLQEEGFADDSPDGKVKRAHVLWTDESPIELYPAPNRQNQRVRTATPESIPYVRRPKFGLKIMIAGGISRYGKTDLVVVEQNKTVDGKYYRDIILPVYKRAADDKTIFPVRNKVILMQDGATCHTARATMNVINRDFPAVWTDWPGNSPDLNVIEHIWSRLQDSVLHNPRPRNREQLIRRVEQEWAAITQEECFRLVESLPRRITQCIERNGQNTDY